MQQQSIPKNKQVQYLRYNLKVLLTLCSLYIISMCLLVVPFVLIFALNNTSSGHIFLLHTERWLGTLPAIGVLLLLAEAITLMILDWHGTLTLRGSLKSQTLYKGEMVDTRVGYTLLYIFFPELLIPIYLLRSLYDYFHTRHSLSQQQEFQKKFEIANFEAKMGILSHTEDMCRVCQKPLIIGANFCQYCGTTVVERPKVCPLCATTALADAKWCPKCRTALS